MQASAALVTFHPFLYAAGTSFAYFFPHPHPHPAPFSIGKVPNLTNTPHFKGPHLLAELDHRLAHRFTNQHERLSIAVVVEALVPR